MAEKEKKRIPTSGKTLSNYPGAVPLSDTQYDIKTTLAANGIYNARDMGLYDKFVRFPGADPFNAMTVTHEYVFFTKPDLHLMDLNARCARSLSMYPFFVDAVERYQPVCEQLQLSINRFNTTNPVYTNPNNPFITLLSNTISSELEVPDLESENDQETGANVYGTKITYRGNSYTADQDLSFSLEFTDTKYLEVYMLFKIYDEYCRYKNLGLIEVTDSQEDAIWLNYIVNKVLHDQFSVYKFVVGEDGMTLIYWGKYTGVFPTGAPRSAFSSMNNQEGQKVTANFKAQFFRDMDPSILSEFNSLTIGMPEAWTSYKTRLDLPLYDTRLHTMNSRWASMPYIYGLNLTNEERFDYVTPVQKMGKYRLMWKY